MATKEKTKELSILETEKVIEAKVEQWKKDNPNKHVFYFKGEGYTSLMRDFWSSDLAIKALEHMGVANGIPVELAIDMVTGKKMAIGDSRVEMLVVDDDGRFKDNHYDHYTIEEMIARHEKYFVNHSNYRAEFVRYLNLLTSKEIKDDDEVVLVEDNNETDWLSPSETRRKVLALDDKIGNSVAELEYLYPLVGKSLKNLPYGQIGTTMTFFDTNKNIEISTRAVRDEILKREKKRSDDRKKEQAKLERFTREARERDHHAEDLANHKHLITEILEEDFSKVGSCWVTNDGKIFGGSAYPFIHDHLCYYLSEAGYFGKDKTGENIRCSEKDVEEMNWIKLSGGHGFMLYSLGRPGICINEAQRETILKWAIANDEDHIELNNADIDLKTFANADLEDLMEFRFLRYSTKYKNENGEEQA